ncbi:hypothetical protein VKT23_015321 [Stygiomarasmius scandens]|uniref:Uncharacterized protein n=1 Tax=Marasmiellus scandens TaxID=2682957 RepID=A0ABR1J0T7_9AGAR
MKLFTAALSALSLATVALGQSAHIGFPTDGATVSAGSPLSVNVIRPNTISSSEEVAVVIGIASCTTSDQGCLAPNLTMGSILYNGPFDPQIPSPTEPPSQNITVDIPSDIPKGETQLNFAHFFMVGASLSPSVETSSVSITIV